MEKEKKIIEFAVDWIKRESESYLRSGLIYPRDIYSEQMIKPETGIDRTLMEIDHKAIRVAKSDPFLNHFILHGKWLIFIPRSIVDEVWESLSNAIEAGDLPYKAKVATAKDSPLRKDQNHVICVYTPNFLLRKDVRNCRDMLRRMGFQERLYYKPDIFTYMGKYRIFGSKINHRYFG